MCLPLGLISVIIVVVFLVVDFVVFGVLVFSPLVGISGLWSVPCTLIAYVIDHKMDIKILINFNLHVITTLEPKLRVNKGVN